MRSSRRGFFAGVSRVGSAGVAGGVAVRFVRRCLGLSRRANHDLLGFRGIVSAPLRPHPVAASAASSNCRQGTMPLGFMTCSAPTSVMPLPGASITAMVSRETQVSRPASSCNWMSQTWERPPRWIGRAVPVTRPVRAERR